MDRVSVFSLLVLLVCCFSVSNALWWYRRPVCFVFPTRDNINSCNTCNLFSPRQVTLRVRNVLKEPTFDEKLTMPCSRKKTVFYLMMEAAQTNSIFRFTSKYYGSELGFFVQGINDVFGNYTEDKSYWEILDGNMNSLSVGVSTYEPRHGETVTFNFTRD